MTPPSSRYRRLFAAAAIALVSPVVASAATPPNTLVMAWNIDAISTFDPAQIGEVVTDEILRNACDTLVDFDPDDASRVVPSLARSWSLSDDGLILTFNLREDMRFPSGNPVSASDVAWSMKRVVELGFGNAATLEEYGFTADRIDQAIEAPDAHTLMLHFDHPYPQELILQAIAANRVASALDQETLMAEEVDGDLGNRYLTNHTECAGPYRLRQWNAGEAVVLEANSDYWGEAPKLPQVLIRHVAEAGTQRLLLARGDVDVARDLAPEDLRNLDGSDGIEVVKALKPQLFYWNLNNGDPIFANPKVRQAMRYLVDYQGLADTVMAYSGMPRASFVPLGSFGALDETEGQPFRLDLDEAKRLLEEAGYPDGFETRLIFGTLPYSAPIAQSLQQNAAKVGVRIELERMANAQLFSRVRGREYQSAIQSWMTSVADAHGMASRLLYNPDNRLEARQSMYPSWRAAYYSDEVNQEVQAALLEADPSARETRYHALQREMFEQGPFAILFQMYDVAGKRVELHDWKSNGFRVYYDLASK